ncbi:DUF5105 domain-containing protein [Enterococcus olivae]
MKRKGLFSILLVIGFLLAGCDRGIPAEEAAPLFIDRFIYQEETKAFNENFQNGEALGTIFEEQQEVFQEHFIDGLIGVDDVVAQEQADEIYQQLAAQVQEKTTYRVKQVTENEDLANIIYEINGISIKELLLTMSQKLVERIHDDNALAKDQTKLVEETVGILKEELPNASIKEQPVDVSLQMRKEKGQWQLVNGQSEELSAIYLAFFTGFNDQEQFVEELTEAMSSVSEEAEESE